MSVRKMKLIDADLMMKISLDIAFKEHIQVTIYQYYIYIYIYILIYIFIGLVQ